MEIKCNADQQFAWMQRIKDFFDQKPNSGLVIFIVWGDLDYFPSLPSPIL